MHQHTDISTSQQVAKSPYTQRATFYFSPEQLRELEEIRFNLLQKHNIKTDKSAIIRTALEEIIKDFREKKQKSRLCKMLS